jgi:hypothetical protein
VTAVTGFSPRQRESKTDETEAEDMPEGLDAEQLDGLAEWYRDRVAELGKEEDLDRAEDQTGRMLREVLAEAVAESAVDTEVDRVISAANKPARKAKKETTDQPHSAGGEFQTAQREKETAHHD